MVSDQLEPFLFSIVKKYIFSKTCGSHWYRSNLFWSLRLDGEPPPRWSCFMPTVGTCPACPPPETSRLLCCPSQSVWKDQQTCRGLQLLRALTESKLLPRLHRLPDQLACKCQRQHFSVDKHHEVWSLIALTAAFEVFAYKKWTSPDSCCRSGSRSPTPIERKQLERSPLNRRKTQEKGLFLSQLPAQTPSMGAPETKTKGVDYKSP